VRLQYYAQITTCNKELVTDPITTAIKLTRKWAAPRPWSSSSTSVIVGVFSQQAADTTQWADTIDWTVRCDWLQVASSCRTLYTGNTMLTRSCRTSCKFYRSCDNPLRRLAVCSSVHFGGMLWKMQRPCTWKREWWSERKRTPSEVSGKTFAVLLSQLEQFTNS